MTDICWGETPEVEGLFCACGFNSVGILSSGRCWQSACDWIHDGHPPVELADVDVRRMQLGSRTNPIFLIAPKKRWAYFTRCTGPICNMKPPAMSGKARSMIGLSGRVHQ